MGAMTVYRGEMHRRYSALASEGARLITSASGAVTIMHAHFDAFEGEGPALPYAILGLCTAGGGRTHKRGDGFYVDDIWEPGKIGLSLPGEPASGRSPAMSALGIAFDPDDIPSCHGRQISKASLQPVANRLFEDSLTAWIVTALWRDAEAHGASSAFFDHGLSLLLHRLAFLADSAILSPPAGTVRDHIASILGIIEERLDEDLRVEEMAQISGVDARSFTRAFKKETGHTPFSYLTQRRMARARGLLQQGLSVTEVATAVGYANPAKFSAAFRRWVGCVPSQWSRMRR